MTLKVDVVENTSGGPVTLTDQHAAKSWIRCTGQGTIAINDSFNVSSIADNGTGNYSVNFTSSMTDANYSHICQTGFSGGPSNMGANSWASQTTSQTRIFNRDIDSNVNGDGEKNNNAVFGDLA